MPLKMLIVYAWRYTVRLRHFHVNCNVLCSLLCFLSRHYQCQLFFIMPQMLVHKFPYQHGVIGQRFSVTLKLFQNPVPMELLLRSSSFIDLPSPPPRALFRLVQLDLDHGLQNTALFLRVPGWSGLDCCCRAVWASSMKVFREQHSSKTTPA